MVPTNKRQIRNVSMVLVLLSALMTVVLIGEALVGNVVDWIERPAIVDFETDPNWTSSNADSDGVSLGWSKSTAEAGGAIGEVGGTLARVNNADRFYGDTKLSRSFTLKDKIFASGKFDLLNVTESWADPGTSGFFIGHFSKDPATIEFIGLEFSEAGSNQMRVRARFQKPRDGGAEIKFPDLSINGDHTFRYSYNPNSGSDGRLTVTIDGTTQSVDLEVSERVSDARFDAFGMGTILNQNSEMEPSKTAQVFIDDVSYSGYIGPSAAQSSNIEDSKIPSGK
jgi:hypothetical protein